MKNLTSKKGKVYFNHFKTLWLYIMVIASTGINFKTLTWHAYLLSALLTLISVGIGHSVGLHRGIIHKSYTPKKWFRNFSIFCAVLTGLGNPINWLKQHYYRDYWQNRKDCPRYFRYQHSLITDYWWNLHLSFKPNNSKIYNIPKADLDDPALLFFNNTWHLTYIGVFLLIVYFFNWNTALFAMCLRTVIITLGHWFIGYASHTHGYASHKIKNADESGYNNLLLGYLSFGEGFHNNHHTYPTSAKFSSAWYEIDLGWVMVCLLQKFGVITDVKTQTHTKKPTAIAHPKTVWRSPFYKNYFRRFLPKYF